MTGQTLIPSEKLCVVQLGTDERWVRLALAVTDEFTKGKLIGIAADNPGSVEGTDELSATYTWANWWSGVMSGALYAYRALGIPRQNIVLTEFSGRLRAADMEAVANVAAIAIATMAGKDLPGLDLQGWNVQTQVGKRPPQAPSPSAVPPAGKQEFLNLEQTKPTAG